MEINRDGARIALKHSVDPGDTLRIVNLENMREADFRVAGPKRLEENGVSDWGVACLDTDRNLWDIKFSPPLKATANEPGALLKCGECGTESFSVLRDWEIESLDAGYLQRFCETCSGPTKWQYADGHVGIENGRPTESPPEPEAKTAAPPPLTWVSKRAHKRLAMKLPILVRDQKGGRSFPKPSASPKAASRSVWH